MTTVVEEAAPPCYLLSLPVHLLSTIVARLRGSDSKTLLRATCSSLRDVVDAQVSKLEWLPKRRVGYTSPTRLHLPLLARLPQLETLDCRAADRIDSLLALSSCTRLQNVDVQGTSVGDLGPLRACPGLRRLNCSETLVSDLSPLTACPALISLDICSTNVADLTPLTACKQLLCLCCLCTHVYTNSPGMVLTMCLP